MIPDKIFRNLEHTHKGFTKHSNGQPLEIGYKPDFVLRKGNEYIIIECENNSSRKGFVGALIKAAHFLQEDKIGKLIFITGESKSKTPSLIAKHLKQYLIWIENKTNLREVLIINSNSYYINEKVLSLTSKDFKRYAIKV